MVQAKVPTSDVDGVEDDDEVDIWNGVFSPALSFSGAMLLSVTESIFGRGGRESVVVVTTAAW